MVNDSASRLSSSDTTSIGREASVELRGVRDVQLGDNCGADGGRHRFRRYTVHPEQGGELLGVSDTKTGQSVRMLAIEYGAERRLAFHDAQNPVAHLPQESVVSCEIESCEELTYGLE